MTSERAGEPTPERAAEMAQAIHEECCGPFEELLAAATEVIAVWDEDRWDSSVDLNTISLRVFEFGLRQDAAKARLRAAVEALND